MVRWWACFRSGKGTRHKDTREWDRSRLGGLIGFCIGKLLEVAADDGLVAMELTGDLRDGEAGGVEVVEACVIQEAFRFGLFCSGLMPNLLYT